VTNEYIALFSSLAFLALVHTSMPSHWLCFVAVGRAQGWKRHQVLMVTAVAGLIHVATTIALGVAGGMLASQLVDKEALGPISAILLMALGALYLVLHFIGMGHHHDADHKVPDRWAIGSLVLAVTVSPCSASIPILVAAAGKGPKDILLVSAVLLVATVGNMLLLVTLGSLAVERLQFRLFDRYEKLILGLVLAALGGAILLFGHHH
jgi:hypothetical protein